jgi:hypothetical protein
MKSIKILCLLFACVPVMVYTQESPTSYEMCAEDTEKECRKAIDDIFAQARESITAKEDIITREWLARKEIKEIQNLMSDSCIILSFDCGVKNVIPESLELYLQTKIRDELDKVLAIEEVSMKRVDQFFDLSKIVCALSQGADCQGMMRSIKDENSRSLQRVKLDKEARRKMNKDQARELRERIILGAHPRK